MATPQFCCWQCGMRFENPDYLQQVPSERGMFCDSCAKELETQRCHAPQEQLASWILDAAREIATLTSPTLIVHPSVDAWIEHRTRELAAIIARHAALAWAAP